MTIRIIKDLCNNIYNTLGSGYRENIYVNALCVELREKNYLFGTEVIVPINYKNVQVGFERADIIIYEPFKCILEFKAQHQRISDKEITQLNKYLKNFNSREIQNGLLINFGNKLEFHEIDTNKSIII